MVSRRTLLAGLATAPLAACALPRHDLVAGGDDLSAWYVGLLPDEPHAIPLVDRSRMKPELRPQTVPFTGQPPGTIVVDIDDRFLYHVQADGKARRYGVGVGRQGFSWKGAAYVGRKAKWPGWAPTSTMVKLKPELARYASGLSGGVENPLGARALYLYQEDRDILFRIHGTNEPWTIGEQVSSGCVRMLNEDIHELYSRVPIGTAVLVRRDRTWRV